MTSIITYCDLCGKVLEGGNSGCRVLIGEFARDACGVCARKLIDFITSGPWKPKS
jgi:hypothetical protein